MTAAPERSAPAGRTRRRPAGGVPLLLVPPGIVAVIFLALPTVAMLIRMPWTGLADAYRGTGIATAFRISIVTSLEATAISFLLGVPLAWLLARVRVPGMGLVRAVVVVPLVLPPVVGGVALFAAFGRRGIIGRYLDRWFGIDLPFTQHAVVIAETFVAMPFLVVTVEAAFRAADHRLEEAAATLGASRLRIFTHVTLPLVLPALVAGSVLCWARAIGEFGATLLFASDLPGTTETLPLLVLKQFQNDPTKAVPMSLPLILVALIVLGGLRDRWLRSATAS